MNDVDCNYVCSNVYFGEGETMAANVRIHAKTYDQLRTLAERSGASMPDVLDTLLTNSSESGFSRSATRLMRVSKPTPRHGRKSLKNESCGM